MISLVSFVDKNKLRYIDVLKTAVAIQSVSTWPEKREEVEHMVRWTEDKLKELGAETKLTDIGKQTLPNGNEIHLPKILLATLGKVKFNIICKEKMFIDICTYIYTYYFC